MVSSGPKLDEACKLLSNIVKIWIKDGVGHVGEADFSLALPNAQIFGAVLQNARTRLQAAVRDNDIPMWGSCVCGRGLEQLHCCLSTLLKCIEWPNVPKEYRPHYRFETIFTS
jgi:hypothetical protein